MALGSRIMRMESAQEVGEHIFSHPYNANSEEKKKELLDEAFLRLEQVLKARVVHENVKTALNSNPSQDELRMAQYLLNQQPQWLQSPTFRMESSTPSIGHLRMRMEADENIFTRFWNWLKEIFNKIFGSSDSSPGGGPSSPSTATETEAAARTFVQQQQAAGVEEIHLDPTSGVGKALLEISSNIPGKSILEVLNLYIGDSLANYDFFTNIFEEVAKSQGKGVVEVLKAVLDMAKQSSSLEQINEKVRMLEEQNSIESYKRLFSGVKKGYIDAAFGENVKNLKTEKNVTDDNRITIVLTGPNTFSYRIRDFKDGVEIGPIKGKVEVPAKEKKALYIPFSEFNNIATLVSNFAEKKEAIKGKASKVIDKVNEKFFSEIVDEVEKIKEEIRALYKEKGMVDQLPEKVKESRAVTTSSIIKVIKDYTDELFDFEKGNSAIIAGVLKAINEVTRADVGKAKEKRKSEAEEKKKKDIEEAMKAENFWTKDGTPDEEFKKFIQVVITNKEFRDNLSFVLDKKGVEYLEQVKKEARKLYDTLEEKDRVGKKANEAREAVKKDLAEKVKKIKEEENK